MTSSITERYDRNARDYERYWAPVLEASARRLLDECDAWVRRAADGSAGVRIVDVGTGTGTLAVAALERWPRAELVAVDASKGMLDVARRRAERLGDTTDGRLEWHLAEADHLPLEEASVDLVISSFVYQLVPDRAAALAEARRVLRPRGRIALVSWLIGRGGFAPDDEFDEAVVDLGISEDDEPEEQRSGDFRSVRAATEELRRAGFRRVSARREHLEYAWTLDSYLEFKESYDERTLMATIDDAMRTRLMARARDRLERLLPDTFRWRVPIVYASGERASD